MNNFNFSDDFVKALWRADIDAGVDYVEFGYRASKKMFKPEEFGKWKFCDEQDLQKIVSSVDSTVVKPKVAIMADAGRCEYKSDILPREKSAVDLVRVACYIH